MKLDTLTIVGVGLIGGSIGLAAKRRGVARRVLGVGRHPVTLERARQLGAIDQSFLEVQPADLIVLCTPVDTIFDQALRADVDSQPGTLLTDVGSTKGMVHDLELILQRVRYVGSHPLAGSEKSGVEFADADLFQDRLTVVTQTPATDSDALEQICVFWRALGSRVRIMTPTMHDSALAQTSHLPHVVAAALARTLWPENHDLTATGFRDTTRVAAGDRSIWKGILLQNRWAILMALDAFTDRVAEFRKAIEASDASAIDELLTQAKKVRDALGAGASPHRD